MNRRPWGEKFPDLLAAAQAEVVKVEEALADARRRVTRLESEIAGYESQTRINAGQNRAVLAMERDRLGKDTSGSSDLMGRYLALIDAIGDGAVTSMSDLDLEITNVKEGRS